jgi:hypothetical protein
VGALWGTLEAQKRAEVVDLNETGALLWCPVALTPNSVHSIEVAHGHERQTADVLVKHVRPADAGAFHVGVEFLSPLFRSE